MFLDEIAKNLLDKKLLTAEDIQKAGFENILNHLNISDETALKLQNMGVN